MRRCFALLATLAVSAATLYAPPTVLPAQMDPAPCGYVDGFDFPIPDLDTEKTDFAVYRQRFNGLHTGIDLAFGQLGYPVRAAATGRVTFSDVEGWDTEKGVVVIQHTFPGGTQVSTVYGHMEELHGHTFPPMGSCVRRGEIIGAVGDPSLSAVHLHYEVRVRYRHEGGPGYTSTNPLALSWFHPIDFTYLARVWIDPAYVSHFSLTERPTLPLLRLPDGSYVAAQGKRLSGLAADGTPLWQFDTLTMLTGLLHLSDGRILATNTGNQVIVLNHGSISALWSFPGRMALPPLHMGNAVVFAGADNVLSAYTPEGQPLWSSEPLPDPIAAWAVSADRLAVTTTGHDLLVFDATGATLFRQAFPQPVALAPESNGEFLVLTGTVVARIDRAPALLPLFDTGYDITASARIIRDPAATFAIYPGIGRTLYAYDAAGNLLWVAYMPGRHAQPPRLAVGGGAALYALTADGQLLAFSMEDGHLVGQLALYDGGSERLPGARWLEAGPDEQVTFNSGYLSVVTVDGYRMLALDAAASASP